MTELRLHIGRPSTLDAVTLYRILQLRVAVFVVEQRCPYPELDGRDLEPDARWIWAGEGERVLATLRMLSEDADTVRIGRVATDPGARSRGIGRRLMEFALRELGERDVVLDAQWPLEAWYQRLGFSRCGEDFVEDGIPHVPMRRSRPS